MIKINIWMSEYSGSTYETTDLEWMPKFGGWTLIGTVEKEA